MSVRSASLLLVPLWFAAGVAAGAASAAPRLGEAEVRESSTGIPCFTISEREERRAGAPDFHSITVFDASMRSKAAMWSMEMPARRTFPVSFSMCIPYAGRLRTLPQTAAAALRPGRIYEVQIATRPGRRTDAPRSYATRFCLVSKGVGRARVHHIDAGAVAGRNQFGCAGR